jgi:hypothetical protein
MLSIVPGAVGNTPPLDSTGGNIDAIEIPTPATSVSKRVLSKNTDIPSAVPKKSKSTNKPKGSSATGSSVGDSEAEDIIVADDPGLSIDPAALNRNTTNPIQGKPRKVVITL